MTYISHWFYLLPRQPKPIIDSFYLFFKLKNLQGHAFVLQAKHNQPSEKKTQTDINSHSIRISEYVKQNYIKHWDLTQENLLLEPFEFAILKTLSKFLSKLLQGSK
jgi:hypothetical protein